MDLDRVMTSGNQCDVMVRTLGWNARDVCSIPKILGKIFLIFIIPRIMIANAWMQVKLRVVWLLNLP